MRFIQLILLAFVFVAQPCWSQAPMAPQPQAEDQRLTQQLADGVKLLKSGRAQEAISQAFDKVIAYYEENHRKSKTFVFSSRSMPESMMYMLEVANKQSQSPGDAAVFSSSWGDAYYLKAYALVELKRLAEAREDLERALALAPRNSQYRSELGTLQLMERNWPAAMLTFKDAEAAAREFSPPEVKTAELTRALRGQGYVLIEQNRLDEARKIYQQCLELDANDANASGQLRYVQEKIKRAGIAAAVPPLAANERSGMAGTFDDTWAKAERQNAGGDARSYLRYWVGGAVWNDQGKMRVPTWPQDKAIAECVTAIFPSPTQARLAFALDEKGVVQEAYTDQTGFIDECVKSKVVGLRVPAPPAAPFLLCAHYEKQSDQRTTVSGCGLNHFSRVCEQKGTTATCSVYQR